MRKNETMTRIKLVDTLYENHGFNRTEARLIVDTFFEELCLALAESETVKISGFGSFHLRNKRERIGRNPKTGEECQIKPRSVIRFRASNKLREKINLHNQQNNNPVKPQEDRDPFEFST